MGQIQSMLSPQVVMYRSKGLFEQKEFPSVSYPGLGGNRAISHRSLAGLVYQLGDLRIRIRNVAHRWRGRIDIDPLSSKGAT